MFLRLRLSDDLDQLGHLFALVVGIAADDRVLDAILQMIGEDDLLNPRKPRASSANLRHHIEAIAPVLEHLRKPAHLSFDLRQSQKQFLVSQLIYHTPVPYSMGGGMARR